jgi:hypothetical protein
MVTQSAKLPRPLHPDAELGADRAVRAVGGDQIAGADDPFGTAAARAQPDRYALVVLREAGQLGAEAQFGAERPGVVAQHGLETDLGDEQSRRRAQPFNPVIVGAIEAGELPAAQTVDCDNGAVLDEFARRRGLDRVLQADAAEDFHRSLVEGGSAGVDRRPPMPLDQQVRNPMGGEQHRRGQPDQTAADDQDRYFLLGHWPSLHLLPPASLG